MAKATILETGFYTSIQDEGRFHYRHLGIPHSGCMDQDMAGNANALLGNPAESAILEMIIEGATIKFQEPTHIIVMGKIDTLLLNNLKINANQLIKINALDILNIGRVTHGHFIYLAIQGGWQTQMVLGSRSMYSGITSNGFLKKDQTLEYHSTLNTSKSFPIKALNEGGTIKVFPGPEYADLPDSWKERLKFEEFELSASWNRMAYSFATNVSVDIPQIKTAPVLPGTVQLTPTGNLNVLMRDAQSTGGYPRILQIADNDLNRLCRIQTGDKIFLEIENYTV
ncbi:5-oxoprolinase subunit C family protein [Nonlabens antarcticus]|uniref:5-oxoprolinase subunit C family protein n=1 Tax=Nonlabens antarcticus TaxID=392714 RepID=UPI001890D455|nr:allophanate hydrolase subunit 2 family protein [Nonlabens antarcticus]